MITGKKQKMKAGVSLVTVLLFMLVATIAATATYKWLTSEGRSSSSRLLRQEAYQSSVAGIENARTWMTFHANDVGALIKAYLDNDRKPINLDARLRPLQKVGQDYHVWLTGVNTENSTYKLKIMSSGEARNNTRHSETAIFNVDGLYQVKVPHEKVVSSVPFEHNYFGGSTFSAGHVKAHSLLINGNLEGSNPVYTDADLVVTGDVKVTGSSIGAGGTTCVGGDLDANNGVLGKDFYVVGNAAHFSFPTTSEAAKLTNANVTGNVYIGGDLEAPSTGNQQFQKNLTIMGKWKTHLGAHEASVAGNMCVGEHGQVEINSTGRTFHVDGNVWSYALYPIWWTGGPEQDHNKYNKIILGNKTDSKVYVSSGMSSSEYATLRNNRAFVESRYYYRGTAGSATMLTWDARTYYPYQNVPAVEGKYCLYKYDGPGQDVDFVVTTSPWGMGGTISYANYYVDDHVFYTPSGFGFMPGPAGMAGGENHLLNMSGNKPTGSPYCKAAPDRWRPECRATPWFKSNGEVIRSFSPTAKNFDCAEKVQAHCDSIWEEKEGCNGAKYKVDDILVTAYDKFKEYANKGCTGVTQWKSDLSEKLNACYETNSSNAELAQTNLYNGYQVVKVADNAGKSDPRTPLKGKFIIIVDGPMGQQSLPPTTSDSYVLLYLTAGQTGDAIQPATNTGIYNYFIYTTANIKQFLFNNADFSGSVYATASTCAKVEKFQTRNMIYNDALMKDLATNGVVCPADVGASCGGTGTSTTTTDPSGSTSTTAGVDSYYISMAPQLGVRLESQYKSNEPSPAAGATTELPQSFIVLPRVIYLPSDPYGKLTDYYNVQALNGSTLRKSDVTASCTGPGSGALNTTGTMFNGTPLTKGIYSCSANTSVANHTAVPFWVVVGDATRGIPPVSFIEPSHQMDPSEEKEVQISVPVRATSMDIEIYCPEVDNEGWEYASYGAELLSHEGTSCKYRLAAGGAATLTVFTIKTTNASLGTMSFQIMPGEGYIPGTYATTQLFIASSSVLDRAEVSLEQRKVFCDANPDDCPADTTGWPDCSTNKVWVEPSGTPYSTISSNNSWTITIGNAQPVVLAKPDDFDDCVVIIPTAESNSIAANAVVANTTYTLYASAKAKAKSFKMGFAGNVGAGNYPTIQATIGSRIVTCEYNNAQASGEESVKTCTATVYDGETVSLKLLDGGSSEFNYWDCSGGSCPTTSAIVSSKTYDSFTVSDNATVVLAHFGERDKHCFFDEFKNNTVVCNADAEYCVDNCGTDDAYSTCAELSGGIYPNAKWHLMAGEIGQIVVGSSGEIHIDKSANKGKKESDRTSVRVLSTVNAGIQGTLKALINVPRATASYDNSATNIKHSGFMLRSNEYGNDYFMLNFYENTSGRLEAQLWRGGTSLTGVLEDENGNQASVDVSSMVMVAARLTAENTLELTAYTGGYYYGSPTPYTYTFNLMDFNNALADMAHEFVGYSLADPNFNIYGIGWLSDTYNAECHDTYPTVKCSFAAVATNGVIPTATAEKSNYVKPWIGYSGWFEANNCTPLYYYVGGNDATISNTDGYSFAASGRGLHGYMDGEGENKTERKTAKAWLGNCSVSSGSMAWGVTAEKQMAHCGTFWTGTLEECTAHQDLFSGTSVATDGSDATIPITEQSLRAATLHVTLENSDGNEVEIWLESKDDNAWGNNHVSSSVRMSGNTASFDVLKEFVTGSTGFDPEHVTSVVVRNHGTTSVTVTAVSTTCANAIGITNCRAEYNGEKWNVTTQVTNKNSITSYQVVASVNSSEVLNSGSIGSQDIVWDGDLTYVQLADDPYESHQNQHYVFVATIKGAGDQEVRKNCSVTPDPIGTISANCSVVGTVASGAQFPTFNVDFNGCPGDGCAYEIYLDGVMFASGTQKTTARHAKDQSEVCTSADGCEHTYTVKSSENPKRFDDCSATFKVVRNAEDIPPTATCGISINQTQFTNDPISVATGDVYFLARNNESVEKQYNNLELKEGETSLGTMSLNNWSQITNKSLGSLSAGTHTYSLFYNGEKVCDASVTVSETSDICTISGSRIEGQPLSIRVSGVRSNTQFTWTLDNKSQTIDCDATHCWNNTMKAPAAGGPYTYTVKRGTNTICTGTVSTDPILSCSATPNPVGKGLSYTFTANAAVRCTNCTFTNEANATENNIVVPAGGSWTKVRTPNSLGDKTPGLSCSTCENNTNASCTVSLKVVTPKPVFECSETLTATVGKDNNVKLRLTGILGCDDDDCDYLISGTNADGQYHSGCTNTSCNLPAITNKTKTDGQTDTYQVTLKNDAGETTKDCEVTFTAGPTITCSCVSVCGEGCQTRIRTTSLDNTNFTGCMFFKDISTLQFNNYTLNGESKSGQFCWENASDCATKLAAIDKIDGGYYVKVENQTGYMKVNGSPAEDPCAGSGAGQGPEPVVITVGSDIQNYYNPSQEQEYDNGTCFSLVGTWDKTDYNPKPALNCQNVSGSGMTWSYGNNPTYVSTPNGNWKQDFGVTLQQTTTTTTFINNVCVTSGSGSKIKCKFEN